jgi:hypothetical protein
MVDADAPQVQVSIGTDSAERAGVYESDLKAAGATSVATHDHSNENGILPIIAIVVGAVVVAGAISDLIRKWKDHGQPEQIISYHDGKVDVQIVDKIHNGKIIVVADKDTVVQIDDLPDSVNITDIAKAAVSAGAGSASDAVKKAGGKASVQPASSVST